MPTDATVRRSGRVRERTELLEWQSWPPQYEACPGEQILRLVDPGKWPSEWLTNRDLAPRCSHSKGRCCRGCFRACVREAVRFRFEGDSEERQKWLQQRRQEMEAAAEQSRRLE